MPNDVQTISWESVGVGAVVFESLHPNAFASTAQPSLLGLPKFVLQQHRISMSKVQNRGFLLQEVPNPTHVSAEIALSKKTAKKD